MSQGAPDLVSPIMSLSSLFLIGAVGWLAYANGANDNFKGVATLFGTRTASYRRATFWAMVTTLLGSATAILLGGELIKAFSGKGLVGSEALADPGFLLAVAAGAAATVLLASRIGFPISTTHAILGALIGTGLLAPGGVMAGKLVNKFVLPLLLTPFAALAITFILYLVFRWVRIRLGITRESCLCMGRRHIMPISVSAATFPCHVEIYRGEVVGIRAQSILDTLHYLSAGAVGFARGLQDTAKIVGLLVGASLLDVAVTGNVLWGVMVVGVLMAAGGMLNSRRLADTLGHKITPMNSGQGFTANLVTSCLVIGTALFGMPVSTTHCSVGSLFGIGAATRSPHRRMALSIVAAWVITLPAAALLAGGMYLVLRAVSV